MADIVCPVCGRLNPGGSVSCAQCGSPLAAPDQWSPAEERKVVTVVFVDLSDFTTLGGRLDPEATRTLITRFFAAARDEVRRFGGSVEKFIGDAVMAVFGLPAANEDDPARAVEAALAIRTRLEGLNESFRAEFGLTVSIHAGVNTGEVLAAVGPAEGRDFLITGDAVNIAARLHERAGPNQILVGERTYRFGRRFFDFRPAAPLTVKGRDEPLAAWEVAGALPVVAPRVAARLVGRAEELTRLRAIAEETFAARHPQIVVVTGNPGIGKSRLVAEFREGFGFTDSPVFRSGRCLPRGEAITYLPLADILKHECGIVDADTAATARTKITAALASLGADEVADSLAYTIGLDIPDSPVTQLDPRAVGQELVRAWRVFFEAKARTHPLVIILEDLHWAGDPLLELVEAVARGIAEAPLLFVATARPDLGERRRRWGQTDERRTVIRLDPLSRDESERLLDTLLSADVLPQGLRDTIVGRAEGNPFFIEEMVRMLADDGVLVQDAGGWRLGRVAGQISLPDTIHAVIAARIDHLPASQKATLQQAAVIGRTFWLGALRALAGASDVGDAIEALERKEFIQDARQPALPGEREYAFKHVLIHEVAYGSLPRGTRGRLHHEVGKWLEQSASARFAEGVDLLAHHYQQAAALTRLPEARRDAAMYLRKAGEGAYRRHALDQAIGYARDALTVTDNQDQGPLFELLGDAVFLSERSTEAEQYYRQALARYGRPLDQARARRKLAPTLRMDASPSMRMEAAEVELRHAQALLTTDPDPTEEAAVLTWLARVAHYRMNYDQAVSSLKQAGMVLRETQNRADLAWALLYLSDAQIHRGKSGEALAAAQEMIELSHSLQNPLFVGLAHWVAARTLYVQGELEDALVQVENGLRAGSSSGNAELAAGLLGVKGTVLARLGRLTEAATCLEAGMALTEDLPETGGTRAGIAETYAAVLADLGRVEEAANTLQVLQAAAATLGRGDLLLRAAIAHLRLLTTTAHTLDAVEACETTLRQWPGSRLLCVQGLDAIAVAAVALGLDAKAEDAAGECLAIAREDGVAFEALAARRTLARTALLRREWASALAELSELSDRFSRMGARLEAGRTLLDAAAAARWAGQPAEAGRFLRQAAEELRETGAAADIRQLERMQV